MNRMLRSIEPIALATTGFGVFLCLQFLVAPVTFGTDLSDAAVHAPVDMQISLRWIQPLLGQAIVEDTLIKLQYGSKLGDAVKTSNRMAMATAHPLGGNPPVQAADYAEAIKADHAARVQWVMGRLIVDLTSQRVQAGIVMADRSVNEGNPWIIAVAQQVGAQLNDAFRTTWQAGLGQVIVTETLNQARAREQNQERTGLIF